MSDLLGELICRVDPSAALLSSILEVINEKHSPNLDIIEQKAQHAMCTGELTLVRMYQWRVA